MCGIAAYIGEQPLSKHELTILMVTNLKRGKDSAGYYDGDRQTIRKALYDVDENLLIDSPLEPSTHFIGHCRASTTTYTTKDVNNAHPFAFKNVILVHNGTIDNLYHLKQLKPFVNADNKADTADVDSKYVAWRMSVDKTHKSILEDYSGKAALIWTTKKNNLFFYRDKERPLYKGRSSNGGLVLHSLESSLKLIGCTDIEEVPIHTVFSVNKKGDIINEEKINRSSPVTYNNTYNNSNKSIVFSVDDHLNTYDNAQNSWLSKINKTSSKESTPAKEAKIYEELVRQFNSSDDFSKNLVLELKDRCDFIVKNSDKDRYANTDIRGIISMHTKVAATKDIFVTFNDNVWAIESLDYLCNNLSMLYPESFKKYNEADKKDSVLIDIISDVTYLSIGITVPMPKEYISISGKKLYTIVSSTAYLDRSGKYSHIRRVDIQPYGGDYKDRICGVPLDLLSSYCLTNNITCSGITILMQESLKKNTIVTKNTGYNNYTSDANNVVIYPSSDFTITFEGILTLLSDSPLLSAITLDPVKKYDIENLENVYLRKVTAENLDNLCTILETCCDNFKAMKTNNITKPIKDVNIVMSKCTKDYIAMSYGGVVTLVSKKNVYISSNYIKPENKHSYKIETEQISDLLDKNSKILYVAQVDTLLKILLLLTSYNTDYASDATISLRQYNYMKIAEKIINFLLDCCGNSRVILADLLEDKDTPKNVVMGIFDAIDSYYDDNTITGDDKSSENTEVDCVIESCFIDVNNALLDLETALKTVKNKKLDSVLTEIVDCQYCIQLAEENYHEISSESTTIKVLSENK